MSVWLTGVGRAEEIPTGELPPSPQIRRMDRLGRLTVVAAVRALRDARLAVLGEIPDRAGAARPGRERTQPGGAPTRERCLSIVTKEECLQVGWNVDSGDGSGFCRGLLEDDLDPRRVAVGWATELGSLQGTWTFQERVRTKGARLANPLEFPNLVQNAVAGHLSIVLGLRGPSATFCHRQTCGLEALAWARTQLLRDRADVALVGVTEEMGPLLGEVRTMLGEAGPAPEGSVALVLEQPSSVRNRGACTRARVLASAAGKDARQTALRLAGLAGGIEMRTVGYPRAGGEGRSALLPLRCLAESVEDGALPAAVIVRSRGGACRAVVLGEPRQEEV